METHFYETIESLIHFELDHGHWYENIHYFRVKNSIRAFPSIEQSTFSPFKNRLSTPLQIQNKLVYEEMWLL